MEILITYQKMHVSSIYEGLEHYIITHKYKISFHSWQTVSSDQLKHTSQLKLHYALCQNKKYGTFKFKLKMFTMKNILFLDETAQIFTPNTMSRISGALGIEVNGIFSFPFL